MMKKQLDAILWYACQHVPHFRPYQDLGKTTRALFAALPPMQKKDILADRDQFLSDEYKTYPKNQFIEMRRTSGSTGHYLKVLWDVRDNMKSLLPLWRIRYKYYGVFPEDKFISFYTNTYIGNKLQNNKEFEIGFGGRNLAFCKSNLSEEALVHIVHRIQEFKPVWFRASPASSRMCMKPIRGKSQAA